MSILQALSHQSMKMPGSVHSALARSVKDAHENRLEIDMLICCSFSVG